MTPLQATLFTLQPGKRVMIGQVPVERLQDRYRVNREPALLRMGEVIRKLEAMPTKAKKTPRTRPPASVPVTPLYPDELRCLSVAGKYGYALCAGWKAKEYRDWATAFRGISLIHVSTGKGFEDAMLDSNITDEQCPKTAIIGAVEIVGCDHEGGNYGHVVGRYWLIDQPAIGVKGSFKYWRPRPTEYDRMRAFNEAWRQLKL